MPVAESSEALKIEVERLHELLVRCEDYIAPRLDSDGWCMEGRALLNVVGITTKVGYILEPEVEEHLLSRPALGALVLEGLQFIRERYGEGVQVAVELCRDPEDGRETVEVFLLKPSLLEEESIRQVLQGWLSERTGFLGIDTLIFDVVSEDVAEG